MLIVTNTYNLADLTNVIAAAPVALGLLDVAHCLLYQNQPVISRNSLIGDIVEADFHGYTAAVITWASAFLDPANIPTLVGSLCSFIATSGGSLNPQTIYGYGITNTAESALYAAENFSPEVQIAAVGNRVLVVPQFQQVSQAG